jgi:hypothetical protein
VATFLANVGVNCSHRLRSPLNADGSFTLVPIPEAVTWAPPMLRLPDVWGERAVHLDPDLASPSPTYGDNCRKAPRAFALRRAVQGDEILFLTRLEQQTGPAGFYLVGRLVIEDAIEDVTNEPGPGWWDGNAHVRRARATGRWDGFWVFKGGAGTQLFEKAQPFTKGDAERLLGRLDWRPARTELQTIASYTRTIRRID